VGVVDIATSTADEEGESTRLPMNDLSVFVPLSVPPYWENSERESRLTALFIRVPESSGMPALVARAQRLLAQPDMEAGGVSWITPELMVQRIRRIQDTIKLTAGSIAVLCLVLGGTTLMSLMVANVRDRVTEIGLRRSLGATARDVASLFVIEGCLVTAVAAVGGSLATHLALRLAGDRLPVPLALGPASLLAPVAIAILLGMAFSYWPARSAARIAPAEALRNE
jgi:putative ABC transport system permease protein